MALSISTRVYVRPAAGHRGQAAPDLQYGIFVTSFIDSLVAFVSANAWLGYVTLFLAALLEAVPIIGSVIPGSTIILALSALIPSGEPTVRSSGTRQPRQRRSGARKCA